MEAGNMNNVLEVDPGAGLSVSFLMTTANACQYKIAGRLGTQKKHGCTLAQGSIVMEIKIAQLPRSKR
jgi:hypothetical protein